MSGGRSILGLVPAILAGLVLRRSQALSDPGRAPDDRGKSDDQGRSDEPGYETSDVHIGNTARVMVALMLSAALAVGTMVWMMGSFAASQRRALPSLTPQQTTQLKPPAPNLQAKPYDDIGREEAAQGALLDGYAFTDAARSRARIPIDRAMRMTVGRPLDPATP